METIQRSPQSEQSDDGVLVVVNSAAGAVWQICHGDTCLRDGCGARLMARYRNLLVSDGEAVPPQ